MRALSVVRVQVALLAGLLVSQAAATNIRVLVASGSAVSVQLPIAASLPQTSPTPAATPAVSVGSVANWNVGLQGTHLSLNGQDAGSDLLYLPRCRAVR
ncbi:hypothetical protein MF271_12080 [Deinococcus sp. KNUC1210]|uniref:hypothetical protein n=1 Tax=Deinococcus sp. KNUC1210 TaxID=2917691 RepID=UPI001EF0AB99|nr:hypothetical protein [Deinococcus sp. KNUC1210]ULH14733.1 hypothetical protein MF271_12080 [Deinococcus sp. KNUC1210]